MDQSVAIHETLTKEESCVKAVECVALVNGVKNCRLLGLVQHCSEHAIFVYSHRRMAITGDDITLVDIVPISYDFSVVEVSSPEEFAVLGADTCVRITYLEDNLELRLPFGSQTRLFLSEVNRAWSDICEQYPEVEPKFTWLTKYRKVSKGARSIRTSLSSLTSRPFVMSQSKKSETSQTEQKSHGDILHKGHQARDEQIRSSVPVLSNKAQMLGMSQFGLRDNLIKCELLKKEDAYTYIQKYSFFLGTYNVNGQNPNESLNPWLGSTSTPPDIYLVGFQELDLSKEAFLFNDTPKEPEWMLAVYKGLHPDAKYAFVKLVRLVGIMLLMYVKAEHAPHISELVAESVGTGVMGRMGNKGAVAIRFRFHNSDICIVNSHLAAHTEEFERRNQDFKDICRRMQFGQQDPSLPPLTIMKHNVVLWLGDLNYRISDLDVDHVKELIAKKDFETLFNHDQLKRQMDEETVFVGFTEGEIDFPPTYKYDTGSDQWDTSEKCRVPAWCDRILWRGKNVKQLRYDSYMGLKTSDHKPVSSLLEIEIKLVDEESYKRTFEEIVRHIDRIENDCIPSVSVSQSEYHFKDVKFMQHQVQTVTVHNEGQVPCQFEFIQKLDEPAYCKPWLTANPAKGFLAQGASVDIDLEVFVNRSTAPGLNSGQQELEDILILHLERGKDYFISITGSYLPSCFGSSISTLCLLKEPIQDMNLDTIRDLSMRVKSQLRDSEAQEIPKEIRMMVDHLFRNAKKQEDLFQQPGLRTEFEEIRDCLDTGSLDTLPGSNHSVAEALLLFLDALPEPVIPFSFYQQCLDSSSDSSRCRQIISVLPQGHKNLFNFLTAFLQELLKHSEHNRLDMYILASVFAGLLLRSPTKQDVEEKRKAKEFLQHFLVLSPLDSGIHHQLSR